MSAIDSYEAAKRAKVVFDTVPCEPVIWENSDGFGVCYRRDSHRVHNVSRIVAAAATAAFNEVRENFETAFKKHYDAGLAALRTAAVVEFAKLMEGGAA